MSDNQVIWGFHIYAQGDAFVKKGHIALGWAEMGDLSPIPPNREAFKAKTLEVYGDTGHISNSAGQLFRFVHEMKEGDGVLYRSKVDRQIHFGKIRGPYQYRPDLDGAYCNVRTVEWSKTVPATLFSQGALYELGSALTLFQVKNYADEYRAVLSGRTKDEVPPAEDESVALVSEEVEQNTKDFIQKQLSGELKGYPFQEFVANLLNTMGYRTKQSRKGTDEGVDIIAHRDELQHL